MLQVTQYKGHDEIQTSHSVKSSAGAILQVTLLIQVNLLYHNYNFNNKIIISKQDFSFLPKGKKSVPKLACDWFWDLHLQ